MSYACVFSSHGSSRVGSRTLGASTNVQQTMVPGPSMSPFTYNGRACQDRRLAPVPAHLCLSSYFLNPLPRVVLRRNDPAISVVRCNQTCKLNMFKKQMAPPNQPINCDGLNQTNSCRTCPALPGISQQINHLATTHKHNGVNELNIALSRTPPHTKPILCGGLPPTCPCRTADRYEGLTVSKWPNATKHPRLHRSNLPPPNTKCLLIPWLNLKPCPKTNPALRTR